MPAIVEPNRHYITCYDPATAFHLETMIADDRAAIEVKIQKAAVAQASWAKSSFADRRKVMRSLKKWLVDNQEICARVAARDTGKTRTLRSPAQTYHAHTLQYSMRPWVKSSPLARSWTS